MQDLTPNKGRSRKKDAPGRSRKKQSSGAAGKVLICFWAAFVICALIYMAVKPYGGPEAVYEVLTGQISPEEFLAGAANRESVSAAENPAESSAAEPETTTLSAEELERIRLEEESRRAEEESLRAEEESRKAEEEAAARREAEYQALLEQGYHPITQADPEHITLRFAGDILFDPSYAVMASLLQRSGGGYPDLAGSGFDSAMVSFMRGADIFMLNNEFPYSSRGTPLAGKKFTFRARPEYASLMKDIGADLVGVANNHVNDYGRDAMLDTFSTLENISMPFCGAGKNIEEASRPVFFTNKDVKIAIIAATQIERMGNPDTVGATDSSPGVFRCLYDMDRLTAKIRECRAAGCFTIVFIHWGTEGTEHIDDWQLKQGKQIAEAGADVIVGAHPHILQRLDWLDGTESAPDKNGQPKKVPVIYSLGNYLFNSKTLDTGLYELTLNAHDGSLENIRFIPAVQSGCRTRYADPAGSEGQRILKHLREMSPHVDIRDDGSIVLPDTSTD